MDTRSGDHTRYAIPFSVYARNRMAVSSVFCPFGLSDHLYLLKEKELLSAIISSGFIGDNPAYLPLILPVHLLAGLSSCDRVTRGIFPVLALSGNVHIHFYPWSNVIPMRMLSLCILVFVLESNSI